MDKFDDVDDSVVIGYKFESDELIILFVKTSQKIKSRFNKRY